MSSVINPTPIHPLRSPAKRTILAEDGVVLTDLSLQPIAYDRGAALILGWGRQQPAKPDGPLRLPPEVVEALGVRKAEDISGARKHFRRAGVTYTCCAYLLESRSRQLSQPAIALLFQRDLCVDDAVSLAATEYRLTEREQEVFRGILMGDTTKELAARMQRSPNTVKAFLRLIMIKMGVTTRAGVAGKLLNGDWRAS